MYSVEDQSLKELLYKRWKPYSSSSLKIGKNDVWLFLAANESDGHAVQVVQTEHQYWLKLHWGGWKKAKRLAHPLSGSYTREEFGSALDWLLTQTGVVEEFGSAIHAYLEMSAQRSQQFQNIMSTKRSQRNLKL
jgi:hypothetical protein